MDGQAVQPAPGARYSGTSFDSHGSHEPRLQLHSEVVRQHPPPRADAAVRSVASNIHDALPSLVSGAIAGIQPRTAGRVSLVDCRGNLAVDKTILSAARLPSGRHLARRVPKRAKPGRSETIQPSEARVHAGVRRGNIAEVVLPSRRAFARLPLRGA